MRRWAAAISLPLVVLVAACAGGAETADGIVITIDTEGLGQVRAFTLRTEEGKSLEFAIDGPIDLDGGAFPPDHLREHMALAEGIAVAYEIRDGERIVVRLSDAPWLER